MAAYKKALSVLLAFILIITLSACTGEYEITVNDDTPTERNVSSSTPDNTDIEDNSNMENSNQLDGAWPDNEFTRQVPNPEFEVHSVTTNSDSCNITFSNTTIDQLKEYVEILKVARFTTILTRDSEINGVNHYLYAARNANGYEVIVTQSVSYGILNISRTTENGTSSSTPNNTDIEVNIDMGNSNQYGGTWPDNEFTKQVPNPEFEMHSVTTNSNSCNITFSNTTVDQLKEYVETVKTAGFTTTLTRETETRGVTHYLYTAKNADGYEITVTPSVSYGILTINKLD